MYVMEKRTEIFLKALRDKNEEIRRAGAEALEKFQLRTHLETLQKKIDSGEMLDKIRAVYALTDLKGPKPSELLAKAVKDQSEDVRAAAVRVLATSGDGHALTMLVEALNDSSTVVVRCALDGLAKWSDQRLLGPFMKALKNADPGVVEKALEAIARIGDKRAEEAMFYFAAKGNEKMRALAIKALGMMDN